MHIELSNISYEKSCFVYRYLQDSYICVTLSKLQPNHTYNFRVDLMIVLDDDTIKNYVSDFDKNYDYIIFSVNPTKFILYDDYTFNLESNDQGNVSFLYKIKSTSNGFRSKKLYKMKITSMNTYAESISDSFRIMTKKNKKPVIGTSNHSNITTIATDNLKLLTDALEYTLKTSFQ